MLRIATIDTAGVVTVYLEGRLMRDWVDAARTVAHAECTRGPIRIDLARLTFADRKGIEMLRDLRAQGAELVGANAFVQELLRT